MITWDVQITNVNVAQKRANVSATRTDGDTVEVYTYTNAIIGTIQQRQALLQQIWDSHLAAVSNQGAVDAFISGLEQSAKTNLEGRE